MIRVKLRFIAISYRFLSQTNRFCENVTVVMKGTIFIGRKSPFGGKLPFVDEVTVISESCHFSADSNGYFIEER